MTTTRNRLVFFNTRQTEMVTATCRALYRNDNGEMVYESPDQTMARVIDRDLIDLKIHAFSHCEDISN